MFNLPTMLQFDNKKSHNWEQNVVLELFVVYFRKKKLLTNYKC